MKIFWDTNLFIYLWEKKTYAREITALADFMEKGCHVLATSTLTLGEILVLPARSGREDLVAQYCEAMGQIVLIPFEQEAAVCFAKLRAKSPTLRPPDAIQLACAMAARCELFLTNDNRHASLSVTTGMKIQSLGGWADSPMLAG